MEHKQMTAAVIGGGVAGVSAALTMADAGASVVLIEKDDFIGGHAAKLACKAIEECQRCNGCLVGPRMERVLTHPSVEIMHRAKLLGVQKQGAGYLLTLEQRPAIIDPMSCNLCGLCLEVCPQPGAIRRSLVPGDLARLAVDPAACLFFRDQRSTLCRDACPEEAMNFSGQAQQIKVSADAVVLAEGFEPFENEPGDRWGYGQLPDVITAMELENQLHDNGLPRRPSDGMMPERVAFVQCVGSRNLKGNNYCSRVCCGYALRLGRVLRHRFGLEVSVFYMDLQSFGHDIDSFLAAADQDLELIRTMPHGPVDGRGGGVVLEYQAVPGQTLIAREFDLLVLSVGMAPSPANRELADLFEVKLDPAGFVDLDPTDAPGVFAAGAARGPMDVAEVVASAGRAAENAIGYMEGR